MAISELQLNNFKDLFIGNIHNYGLHTYSYSDKGIKEKGGNKTITNKLVTMAEYKEHLLGHQGLGIIPINDDNKCKFAVIDIDVYDQSFKAYLDAIEQHNFPLVPFYSKSGGLHIYIFFKTYVKVKDAVDRLKLISRIMGITLFVKQHKNESLEIFPKQLKLVNGQVGNWINLPYYKADKPKQGLIKDGTIASFNEALSIIQTKLTSIEEIDVLLDDLPYNDAPPCLQTLSLLNMLDENSGRNNYLFSFGVYLKKKDENYFEQEVMEINNNLNNPLDVKEVENTVLSSLRKKDYTYKCTVSPCLDVCDKKVCQTRKYGIGKDGGYFTNVIFGKMTQYEAAEPYYEWEVKTQELNEFDLLRFRNEEEIIKQDTFLKLCFRKLHFLPFKMKQVEWFKLVNQHLIDLKVVSINSADDTSPLVRFKNMFYDFLTTRAKATTKEQILSKAVYFDVEKEKYLFRTKDFIEYLYDYKNFKLFSSGEIHGMLRDIGITNKVVRTQNGKQVRVVEIPVSKIGKEYLEVEDEYEVDFSLLEQEEQF